MNTLILLFIQGDPDAFSKIYLMMFPRLKVIAYRHCRNIDKSMEAVQDVFVRLASMDLASRVQHFADGEANLEGWLMVSVKHRAMDISKIDEGRRKKSSQVRSTFASQSRNLSDETLVRQQFRFLCTFLQPRQRQVIELHVDGYRNEEIADRLNLSYNTVKNNIYEARQRLKVLCRRYME